MQIESYVPTTNNQRRRPDFSPKPPAWNDHGEHEIHWLADTWGTQLKTSKHWQELYDRGQHAPKFFANLKTEARTNDLDGLADTLTNTNPDQWERTVNNHVKAATKTRVLDDIERLERTTEEQLRKAAKHEAGRRSFRLDLAKQLGIAKSQADFQAAVQKLGNKAWSEDGNEIAKVGVDFTTMLVEGEKLEALAKYLNSHGMSTATMGVNQGEFIPHICTLADVTPLEKLTFLQTRMGRYCKSSQELQNEHSQHQKIAALAREHLGDFLIRLAQGQFDSMKLDITTDADTIAKREAALKTWGASITIEDPNGTFKGNHRRKVMFY